MPDLIFTDPRLVMLYDDFDGLRDDLPHYLTIARTLGAQTILDVGCGTGSLASLLSAHGLDVTALDPARASLDFARQKPHADRVRWIHGEAEDLPPLSVDMATMTGNVAQVFLTDDAWMRNLSAIRNALRPGGYLVFEARDPNAKAWQRWTRERTTRRMDVAGVGTVEGWCDVTQVRGEFG
ncbi:MAG: class I SAM-dependent methyltransferase [Myxococcota bacterium]